MAMDQIFFGHTPKGYQDAVEWLKETGQWADVWKRIPAEPYTVVAVANVLAEHHYYQDLFRIANDENMMHLQRIKDLREALKRAKEDLLDWGSYVDGYFREKHNFEADIDSINRVLKDTEI